MKCCISEKVTDPDKRDVLDRINGISFAAFLVMTGVLWLIPKGILPKASWLIGLGVIMLGSNVARQMNGITLSHGSSILGIIILLAGVCGLLGIAFPVFPIAAIVIGLSIAIGIISGGKCCKSDKPETKE